MERISHFIIRCNYYYSLFLGLMGFDYKFRTGEAHVTRRLTFYNAAIGLLLIALTPLQLNIDLVSEIRYAKARHFYLLLHIVSTSLRGATCALTYALNWWQRHRILAVIVEFQRLRTSYLENLPMPLAAGRRFHQTIIRKFVLMLISESMRWVFIFHLRSLYDYVNFIIVLWSISVLHQTISLVFFAACTWNLYLEVLNAELERIWRAALLAVHLRRWDVRGFRRRCAMLSLQLQQLVVARKRLQRLADQLNVLFGTQNSSALLNVYFYSINTVYISYSLFLHNGSEFLGLRQITIAISLISALGYYGDLCEVIGTGLRTLRNFNQMDHLLQELITEENLTPRLQRNIQFFLLRNACDPYETKMLGLFKLDARMLFASLVSIFLHATILMQYDYANF